MKTTGGILVCLGAGLLSFSFGNDPSPWFAAAYVIFTINPKD